MTTVLRVRRSSSPPVPSRTGSWAAELLHQARRHRLKQAYASSSPSRRSPSSGQSLAVIISAASGRLCVPRRSSQSQLRHRALRVARQPRRASARSVQAAGSRAPATTRWRTLQPNSRREFGGRSPTWAFTHSLVAGSRISNLRPSGHEMSTGSHSSSCWSLTAARSPAAASPSMMRWYWFLTSPSMSPALRSSLSHSSK